MEEKESRSVPQSNFRGLYRHVKISVKTLDKIIVFGIAAIVALVLYGVANNGYVITFDSKGGTDVPAQNQMYGEKLDLPEPPTREGYQFTGWFTDSACGELWDMENRTIETDMTLYAGWEKIT